MNTTRRIASWLLVAFLVLMVTLLAAAALHGQTRRWPDRVHLVALADSAGIDAPAALAIAWEESAANLNPHLRGHHCWYTTYAEVGDLTVTVQHHEHDCEVGRYQIRPSTARLRCPGLNILTYAGNTRCFATMFADDVRQQGRLYAIKHHNGHGAKADAYLKRVLLTVGWLTETP